MTNNLYYRIYFKKILLLVYIFSEKISLLRIKKVMKFIYYYIYITLLYHITLF